jgi:hypothetical protein
MYAYLGITVWNLELTGTLPFSSRSIPISSRPNFSVYGLRPTQTSRTSQSSCHIKINYQRIKQNFGCVTSSFFEGSLTFSTVTITLPPSFLAPVTFVLSLNLRPCLVSILWKFLATSASMPTPPIEPRNSTAVTSAPRRDQTDPYHKNINIT